LYKFESNLTTNFVNFMEKKQTQSGIQYSGIDKTSFSLLISKDNHQEEEKNVFPVPNAPKKKKKK
jgi:hypothetical protein